jgi:hypothetical protein
MSSLALPRETVSPQAPSGRLARLIAHRSEAIFLAVPVALLALFSIAQLPREFGVDSWLALVSGRLVSQQGIPHHETLTVMSHGLVWIDQQWLAQLASYVLQRLGGLGLLGTVNCLLITSGVAISTASARRRGASFRTTLIMAPLCVVMVLPSREIRTQAFAVPLFALLISLLARDSRNPSRRVFWCLPVLVLWANLHGSVTLGAALVGLHGLITLGERRDALRRSAVAWVRPLALLLGPAAALMVTPYGLAIVGYYRGTMVSSTLRQTVSEWQPVTSMPAVATGVFLISAVAIWSFGRSPQRTTTWEKLALLIVAASAIEIVRNSLFLALLAMAVVPVSLHWGADTSMASPDRRRVLINGSVALLTGACVILATAVAVARPTGVIEFNSQRLGVLTAVQRATQADPNLHVLAGQQFDDWLLWRDPALSGHLANDVRFELLSAGQINRLQSLFNQVGPDFRSAARGYRLLVLDRTSEHAAFIAFTHEPGRRILYEDGQRAVILRTVSAANRG